MKYLLIIIIVIGMFSCNNHKEINNKPDLVKSDSLQTELTDNSIEFLNLFKNIVPKNLHVYTIEYDTNGNPVKSPFVGEFIDANIFSELVTKYR